MIFAVIVSLCCLVSSVHPFPPQYEMNPRRLRAAAYEASGAVGNVGGASAGAFSSAGTSIIPGPGGSGAFNAKAGIGNIDPSSNFISGSGGGGGGYASGFGGAGAYSGPNGAFTTTGGFPYFGPSAFPGFPPLMAFDFKSFMDQYLSAVAAHQDAIRKQAMSFGMTNGGVGSIAYGQYSPQGGYGAANIYPASGGGVNERFGDPISGGPVNSVSGNLPPPTGTFFGISTHSSSGQSNINGKTDSFKTSSVSVNDNGKVTTYTAHDP